MSSTRIPRSRLTPRKHPRQERSEATVEAILQAAAQVFERHGYAAGTTNRIAERAGVSVGSLYQYFPNKDAILVALVRNHLAEAADVLSPHVERLHSGQHLDDVIPDVVIAMVALHALTPGLHRVLFEETPLPPALRAELDATEDALVETIAAALKRELGIAATDRLLAARIVITCIESLTHRLTLRPPDGVAAELIATEVTLLVRNYLHGLATTPAAPAV
jgi:AcrR family transcriptional regulator